MSDKDVRRAMQHVDKYGAGAKKRKKLHSRKDILHAVLSERKRGTLNSGSGHRVKSKAQALAIGFSEARRNLGEL